jgi:hypothetical protein
VWSWCSLSQAFSANSSAVIIAIFYAVATVGIYGSMLDVTAELALWRCISECNLRRIVRKEKSRAPKSFYPNQSVCLSGNGATTCLSGGF